MTKKNKIYLNKVRNPQEYISEIKEDGVEICATLGESGENFVNFTAGRFIDLLLKNFNEIEIKSTISNNKDIIAECKKPNLRIAYIQPHLECYGGIRRCIEVCNRLVERGHDVTVFTETGQPCDWMETKFRIDRLDNLSKEQYDIGIFTLESQYVEMDRLRAKKKFYWILHYGVLYKNPKECKDSYRGNYRLLANSIWTADQIKVKEGLERPKVIHGGVNHEMFHPVPIKPSEMPKRPLILGYGHQRVWKGRRDLEEAFVLVKEKYPRAELKFFHDLKLPQDKMAEMYSKATCFVSASWFEGWNQMACESLACGCPLIVTNDGGSGDYAEDKENCLMVKKRDIRGMAEAIIKLLGDKKERERLKKIGPETVKRFQWDKCVDDLLKEFSS